MGPMNQLNQKLCIHAGTGAFLLLVGGAFLVAGWVPPPSPDQSAAETVETFRDSDSVRIAAAMFFFGSCLFVAPCVAITSQMRRIEGPRHVLADLQIVAAAIGVLAIQIPAALCLGISYRDEVDPSVIITLNDIAWFFLLGAVGSAVMQNLALAACILGSDGSVYPRWIGYLNLWLVSGLMAGVMIPFFKDGPFAWNGAIGFWVVATSFFLWVFVMWRFTAKAIDSEDRT
jgi:hypothetical protein